MKSINFFFLLLMMVHKMGPLSLIIILLHAVSFSPWSLLQIGLKLTTITHLFAMLANMSDCLQ